MIQHFVIPALLGIATGIVVVGLLCWFAIAEEKRSRGVQGEHPTSNTEHRTSRGEIE